MFYIMSAGFEAWHNNARFQAWVRREFLLRAAEEQQAQRQQKGSFLGRWAA